MALRRNGRHVTTGELALSKIRGPSDSHDVPVLRTREQVEATLALLVEALGLVYMANWYDDVPGDVYPTAGEISASQAGAVEDLEFAILELGIFLAQDGRMITVGSVTDGEDRKVEQDHNVQLLREQCVSAMEDR